MEVFIFLKRSSHSSLPSVRNVVLVRCFGCAIKVDQQDGDQLTGMGDLKEIDIRKYMEAVLKFPLRYHMVGTFCLW